MSEASQHDNPGAASPLWNSVSVKQMGFWGYVCELLEYFGYFLMTALCLYVAWSQLTGGFSTPPSYTHKPPSWFEGPLGLLGSVPFGLLCGILLLRYALDIITTAVVFEGEITKFAKKTLPGRVAIDDWFLYSGAQRWRIQVIDAPSLRKWVTEGTVVRITHTSARRRVLRLEVASEVSSPKPETNQPWIR